MKNKNLLCFFLLATTSLFAQVDANKFGKIRVKKPGTAINNEWIGDSIDSIMRSISLSATYKFYMVDTITAFNSSNFPPENECIFCWPSDSIKYPNKKISVTLPVIRLGGYLAKIINDTIQYRNRDSLLSIFAIDTLEIGFLVNNQGKLYDLIYPISNTKNNRYVVAAISNELNKINYKPGLFEQNVGHSRGLLSIRKTKKQGLSFFRKNKTSQRAINFYCYCKIIVQTSPLTDKRGEYYLADETVVCDTNGSRGRSITESQKEARNAVKMLDPIIKIVPSK